MFAVIKTGGKQYRVQKGDVLEVEKLDAEEGKKVTFDQVLLVEDNGNTLVGTPHVDKAQVLAVVLESLKGEKVIVFKKKRRKQYKKKSGHRQEITRVKIEEIFFGDKAPSPKKPAEKAAPPEEKKVVPEIKPEPVHEAEKAVEKEKPTPPKKKETKKPAAKKAAKKVSATKAAAAKKAVKPKDKEPVKPKTTKKETKPKPKVKAKTTTKE